MPSDSASATRSTDDWNPAYAYLASEHEAAHAVAAHHFGWSVDEIQLRPDGGDCYFTRPAGLDSVRAEEERLVIFLAGDAFAGAEGSLSDRLEVHRRTREMTRTPEEQYLLRRRLESAAVWLVAEPAFRAAVWRIAAAVRESGGQLNGDELRVLLESESTG